MIASQICTEGYHQKMNACPDMHEAPPELADALARIDQAKENYISLAREMDEFLYNYVKGMVKGLDRKTGNFVLQLRRPKESNVRGKPRVLVTQIVEKMRAPVSRKTSIRNHKGIVVAKKMSRKVSRRVVRPACIAGVRISRPNFRAPCGRTKL